MLTQRPRIGQMARAAEVFDDQQGNNLYHLIPGFLC
jgi:hypothetical protein